MEETLFPLPEPVSLRVGSTAWTLHEFGRMRELNAKEGGLTTVFFAKIALGVSQQRVHQLMDEGRLPYHLIMGKKMISCNAIDEYLRTARTVGRPSFASLQTA